MGVSDAKSIGFFGLEALENVGRDERRALTLGCLNYKTGIGPRLDSDSSAWTLK